MQYETVIGLEVHAELATDSKIYCACSTAFGADENANVCHGCAAMPGTLPVLNKKVLEYGVRAGLATNGTINKIQYQDRKHYFYPDLPRSFQLTQMDLPVSVGGYVDIETEDGPKRIRLHHIHFEEDAGKLLHGDALGTRVDLNRGSVPLVEIVSEPDMRSAQEARAFLESLRAILVYTGVSHARMQEGQLRCDVNISVRPVGQKEFGVRTEMKNLNSFRSVLAAVEYERKRQIDIIESGGEVKRQTLRWDDATGKNTPMRSKEQADDYMYFPEPDLPVIELDDDYIENIRMTLPELPAARRERYMGGGLSAHDAWQITASKHISNFLDECVKAGCEIKTVGNYISSDINRILNARALDADEMPIKSEKFVKLLKLVEQSVISRTAAAKVLELMFDAPGKSPDEIVQEHNLAQVSDEGAVRAMCEEAIAASPKAVDDYKGGNEKALASLVGQVMKASKGKANPQLVNKLLKELLK